MEELGRNLPRMLLLNGHDPQEALNEILEFTTLVQTIPIYTKSPDTKRQLPLRPCAMQTQSEVIVTKEKVLLSFKEIPVPIHDIKWFKEKYPVNL